MCQERMNKIETFLEVLPEGNKVLSEHTGYSELMMDGGIAFAFGLLNIPEVAVSKTVISAGAGFTDHRHRMVEWVIVFSGELNVTVDEESFTMMPGDGVRIMPGVKHSALAVRNTKILAITIPADPTFPKEA